jgi:Zn-dependent M28 family amino/carboxypeptidase
VLGLLPGTDIVGRGTLLVLAHLDGLGVGDRVGGDSIYNGADDNASGVASVLEVARALARGPRPARDIVFALFSGTERRLAGAEYYLAHPVVPLGETIGVINVEAIGRRHLDSLVVIRGPLRTPLERAVERTAQAYDTALGLTVVSDLRPQSRLWLEGDHSLFFNIGLPILYLYNGPHADLHRPGDNPEKIDFSQTARIARFLALLAHAAATPTP